MCIAGYFLNLSFNEQHLHTFRGLWVLRIIDHEYRRRRRQRPWYVLLNCIKMDMIIPGLEGENGTTVARYRGQRRNVVHVTTGSCIPLPNRTKDTRGREMRYILKNYRNCFIYLRHIGIAVIYLENTRIAYLNILSKEKTCVIMQA